jgi:hypothetical protein
MHVPQAAADRVAASTQPDVKIARVLSVMI